MKICFWGSVSKALNGNTPGGGELQISLLAKTLAKLGHEVVVLDYEVSKEFQTADGIKVLPIKGWNNGIRMIRAFTHRLPSLYSSLRDQKADIYYCRIRDFRHIFAFLAARKVKARFILALASDLDAMDFAMRVKYHHRVSESSLWSLFSGILVELIYPWLLKKADAIFVQHEGQKELLKKKNLQSVLFPNLIDLSEYPVASNSVHKDFIYAGSLDKRKGFIDFFKLVEMAHMHSFKVVGQPRDKTGDTYYKKLKNFHNVSLLGKLNHKDTISQIANSKALISTSPMEGFPNVFLEAWALGIPVLSLYVSFGSVIQERRLIISTHGNLDNLLHEMDLLNNSQSYEARSKEYVKQYHALTEQKIENIKRLFEDLLTIKVT